MWACKKCGEEIEDQFDSCWKCAGEPGWIGLPFGELIKRSRRRTGRGVWAVGLILITWIFFGPITGFHHMYGFGITFYLMLNGEDPQPGDLMWGQYAVKFFPLRFAVALVFWLISVVIVLRVGKFLTKRRKPDAGASG